MFGATAKNIFKPSQVLRQNLFLLFVLLLSGCGLEKKLAQMNRDVPFDVQIADTQFYEGQNTSIQISLLKTYPEEKTLSWRIEDESGNLASASAFTESSGEITLNWSAGI